ncbi:MAG: acyl carrier protein [Planctomycetes bacterium]|nr:acyl carrier protein [Planctomycetota bacterium]
MSNRKQIIDRLCEFLEADTEVRVENMSEGISLREGLGLDSVDLVGIIMRIESEYRIRLSHAELEQVGTVGSLLDLIQAKIVQNYTATTKLAA